VDASTLKALLEAHFERGSSEMYDADAILEFPQSGERFEGVASFHEWRSSYPASTSVEFREIRGRGDLWVAEISITYDGAPESFGVSILELRDEKVVRETIYVSEGWEPPEWRAKWRSAP
jgi:hypothetical protein